VLGAFPIRPDRDDQPSVLDHRLEVW
jgi:hypothetical protein